MCFLCLVANVWLYTAKIIKKIKKMFFSTNKSQLLQFFVIFHRSTKKFLLPHGAKNIVLIVVNIRKLYTFAIRNQSPSNIQGDWLTYVADHLISHNRFILVNNNVYIA